jgi:hypothetical protein
MPQFTDAQLAGLVLGVGFTPQNAITAVAIAIRESAGNSDAVGDVSLQTSTWGPSIGLFQIRSLNAQKGTGGERDETANKDPVTNAKHAYSISGGGVNWKPWSTYKGIAATLGRAQTAVSHPDSTMPTGVGSPGTGSQPGQLNSGSTVWDAIVAWATAGVVRIGAGLAGLILILFALKKIGVSVPMPVPPVAKVAKLAAKVAT